MGHQEHRAKSTGETFSCAVVVTSDTRTAKTDDSGKKAQEILREKGHHCEFYRVLHNQVHTIRSEIEFLLSENVQLIVVIGGTGCSRRDVSIEAIEPLAEKKLEGFGELFRRVSSDRVGRASMLSRALLAVVRGKAIVCLPGSPDAVETGLKEVLLPELGHLLDEANR